MRTVFTSVLAAALSLAPVAVAQTKPLPWQDPSVPAEDRMSDLLGRMSLDEKIAALSSNSSAPAAGFMGASHSEGLNG